MPAPRTYRAEALVLKNAPFGEAGLMVTLHSREWGKLRVVANGARKANSRLVGHLEPLTLTRLLLARGRTLDTVVQAEVAGTFPNLRAGLAAMTRAQFVTELVDGFGSEDSPNEPLYELAVDTLSVLERDPNRDLTLRHFELHLLQVSGFMPELFHCVECRRSIEPDRHRYSVDSGGTLCLDCRPAGAQVSPLSLRALKVLRFLHRSRVDELPDLQTSPAVSREVTALLSASTQHWLGREIRSNSFLKVLERSGEAGVFS